MCGFNRREYVRAVCKINISLGQVTKFSKRDKLVELLKVVGSDRTMVFVETKKNCDFIATHLNSGNLEVFQNNT